MLVFHIAFFQLVYDSNAFVVCSAIVVSVDAT